MNISSIYYDKDWIRSIFLTLFTWIIEKVSPLKSTGDGLRVGLALSELRI